MEFVGADGEAALPLKDVRLASEDASRVFSEVVEAMNRMLHCGIIHGDLSAFNILYDGLHPVIIDFPQAVRVSTHDEPYELFRRDVENVASHFERYGITAAGLADELWEQHYLPARVF
jgi:RIO kinase 1